MPDSEWLERELMSCIADLQWLCDHLTQLSRQEMDRRLRASMAHQQRIVEHMDEDPRALSEGHPLDGQLKAFRDGQRDLLLKIVQRLWFDEKLDCSKVIGRENISAFILRCAARRSAVRHDAALPRAQQN